MTNRQHKLNVTIFLLCSELSSLYNYSHFKQNTKYYYI